MRNIRYWILTADLLWLVGALALAIRLRYVQVQDGISFSEHIQTYSMMMLVSFVVWTLLYFEMNLDGFIGGWQIPAILSKAIVAVFVQMIAISALAFLTQHNYARIVLLYFALFFTAGLVGIRCLVRFLATSRLSNAADQRCVILGNGPVARELASKIALHPELPFHVVGFLFPGESETSNGFASSLGTALTSISTLQALELLKRERVRKLIISMAQPNAAEVRTLTAECRKSSIQVYLVPQWYDLYVSKAELVEIDGLPLLSLRERNHSRGSIMLKRAMDLVLSAGILVLVSPLLFSAALFVYEKKRRGFRTELRCTKDGVSFNMYRLNVDRYAVNPERYERFLIRWSLTELPQLWNVVRGDMSLVGPRPEPADTVKHYSDWQRQRLKVRGGVTGLAQVHGLREDHPSEDKTRFDLEYIFNWSPFLDLTLILQTLSTVAFRGLSKEPNFVRARSSHGASSKYVTQGIVDANRP